MRGAAAPVVGALAGAEVGLRDEAEIAQLAEGAVDGARIELGDIAARLIEQVHGGGVLAAVAQRGDQREALLGDAQAVAAQELGGVGAAGHVHSRYSPPGVTSDGAAGKKAMLPAATRWAAAEPSVGTM